jgi:CHAT domain-containing protein
MKLIRNFVGFGLIILAGLAQGCSQSPSAQAIRFEQRQEDVLRASNPAHLESPRGPERWWRFDGQAGQKITLAADSYEFNVYLRLVDPGGQQIAWADDNGWFFNARIRAQLPTTGQYTVIVSGASEDHFGTYWLSLEAGDRETDWNESAIATYYQKGLEWAERQQNQRAVSWLNLALGQYFRERRQWQRAEDHFTKSLTAAEQAGFTYGQWAVALERGTMLTQRMRYAEALGELQKAEELGKKLRATDQADAAVYTQLGDLYLYMDRADVAEVHYRNAMKQAEKSGLPSALVRLYTSLFDFSINKDREKAIESAQKAYALRQGVSPVLDLTATYTLANSYLTSGKFEEGLGLATAARRLAHRFRCRDREVTVLNNMSTTYYKLNKIDETIRSAREAVELTSPDDEDPNPRRMALQMQANGEMLRGNYETALRLCLEALRTTEDAWARESIEELRQRYLAQSKAIATQITRNLYALNTLHPSNEYARQSFDFAERTRSRALLNQLATLNAVSQATVDTELFNQEHVLLNQISTVGREIVALRAGSNLDPVRLDQLEEQRARLVGERMRLEAQVRRLTASENNAVRLSPLTAQQVQRKFLAAHPNTAILLYQLGIKESFLIVLTREDAQLFKLSDWTTIRTAVTEWTAQTRNQLNPAGQMTEVLRSYARTAHQLYILLIEPAAQLIQGRDLIIVPDDSLYNLAFEALVVNEPSSEATKPVRYLIENNAVSYAPSISVLAEIESRGKHVKPDKEILLVGDAVFNDRDPRAAQPKQKEKSEDLLIAMNGEQQFRTGLNRLPATYQEVVEIAKLAERRRWRPTTLLGFDANKEKIKNSNLSSYRVLHLATHAVADNKDGGFSALVLSLSEKKANEGGVLTAAEIATMKLNADLVVLSACETGSGQKTKAEGVVGLSRAFIVAGAQRVCGSMWKVEDTSTQKLMTAFYEGLLTKELTVPRALQQAKVKLLRDGTLPFYWAPFILVGSPR